MDHKEKHHLKHRKEREQEKQDHEDHVRETERSRAPIHPTWFFAVGFVLVLIALAIWIMLL